MTFLSLRARVRRHLAALNLAAACFVPLAPVLAADDEIAPTNVYLAGAEVRIDRPVTGDLVVAAGRIHVDQPVGGDAVIGAGSLDLQAPVAEDLRAAGGIVTVASRVQGEVLAAAIKIIFTPGAEVHGQTWLAASSVTLGGRVMSAVKVYAREIRITGELHGPLELAADDIEIGESARVYGDVSYRGAGDIKIHPRARVEGKVTRTAPSAEVRKAVAKVPGLKTLRPVALAAVLAFAVLFVAVMPKLSGSAMRSLGAVPGKSLALGTGLLIGVPPVAVLLVITIIGIPVGLVLIAAYLLGLVAGYVVTALLIATRVARSINQPVLVGWRRYAFLAGALLLLAIVTSIPYIGPLVLVLACAGGLGALVLQRFNRHGSRPAVRGDAWPAV